MSKFNLHTLSLTGLKEHLTVLKKDMHRNGVEVRFVEREISRRNYAIGSFKHAAVGLFCHKGIVDGESIINEPMTAFLYNSHNQDKVPVFVFDVPEDSDCENPKSGMSKDDIIRIKLPFALRDLYSPDGTLSGAIKLAFERHQSLDDPLAQKILATLASSEDIDIKNLNGFVREVLDQIMST